MRYDERKKKKRGLGLLSLLFSLVGQPKKINGLPYRDMCVQTRMHGSESRLISQSCSYISILSPPSHYSHSPSHNPLFRVLSLAPLTLLSSASPQMTVLSFPPLQSLALFLHYRVLRDLINVLSDSINVLSPSLMYSAPHYCPQ